MKKDSNCKCNCKIPKAGFQVDLYEFREYLPEKLVNSKIFKTKYEALKFANDFNSVNFPKIGSTWHMKACLIDDK